MENPNLPAVQEDHFSLPVKWVPNPFSQDFALWTSLNSDDPKQREMVANAARKADHNSDEAINTEFLVEHILCHAVDIPDPETGEVTQAIRTVLISPKGETWAFVSKGVFDSLSWLGVQFGEPPWKGGRKIRLIKQATRSKRSILLLEPVKG